MLVVLMHVPHFKRVQWRRRSEEPRGECKEKRREEEMKSLVTGT